MLQALLWDVDGTLAETEHDGHRVAFNQAFAEAGLPWHWDEAVYGRLLTTTGGKERLLRWWRKTDPAGATAPELPARIAALHARKTAVYVDLVARGVVQLRPGVANLIAQARAAGLTLAIATTTTPDNVLALLQATLGADSPAWFACIGAGDVVPRKKPAPDIYQWVLAQLQLPPQAALALEDSAVGAEAARQAGVPTLLARSRYTAADTVVPWPGLLADLDQLGSPQQPARGRAAGADWAGVVDLPLLAQWHARALG